MCDPPWKTRSHVFLSEQSHQRWWFLNTWSDGVNTTKCQAFNNHFNESKGVISVLLLLPLLTLQGIWYWQPFLWMDVWLQLWWGSLFQSKCSGLPFKGPAGVYDALIHLHLKYLVLLMDHWLGWFYHVSVQLHFIERYLRESDQGFDNLSEEDQIKLKEELYVEVNRWVHMQNTV